MFHLGQTCRCYHNTIRHLLQLISRNNPTVGPQNYLEPDPFPLKGI